MLELAKACSTYFGKLKTIYYLFLFEFNLIKYLIQKKNTYLIKLTLSFVRSYEQLDKKDYTKTCFAKYIKAIGKYKDKVLHHNAP